VEYCSKRIFWPKSLRNIAQKEYFGLNLSGISLPKNILTKILPEYCSQRIFWLKSLWNIAQKKYFGPNPIGILAGEDGKAAFSRS